MSRNNQNFKISFTISNIVGDAKILNRFTFKKTATGVEKLKKAISKCFNEAHLFIREDIEEESTGEKESDVMTS